MRRSREGGRLQHQAWLYGQRERLTSDSKAQREKLSLHSKAQRERLSSGSSGSKAQREKLSGDSKAQRERGCPQTLRPIERDCPQTLRPRETDGGSLQGNRLSSSQQMVPHLCYPLLLKPEEGDQERKINAVIIVIWQCKHTLYIFYYIF